jgi:hypothetical protein
MDPRVKPAGDAFGMLSETARLELSATVTARHALSPVRGLRYEARVHRPPQDW